MIPTSGFRLTLDSEPDSSKQQEQVYKIETIIRSRFGRSYHENKEGRRISNLINITYQNDEIERKDGSKPRITNPPNLYVLNAAALTKPHATEQLHAEMTSLNVDLGIISETHLKNKHKDATFDMNGYSLFRRDRHGRRAGGVAIYARQSFKPHEWQPSQRGDQKFELLWVHIPAEHSMECLVGALYHPPKPLYQTNDLIEYISVVMEEIITAFPEALVILAGDMNTLLSENYLKRPVSFQL